MLTENDLKIPVGSVVRLGQVSLLYKLDISQTNAGPRWIVNPDSQFIGDNFDDKPFLMYVHPYQILSYFTDYQGSDLKDTLREFSVE